MNEALAVPLLVLSAYGLWLIARDWRSDQPMPEEPEWWFLDGPSWRGLVRTAPAGAAEGVLIAIVGLSHLAGDARWAEDVRTGGQVVGIAALALLAVIVLLNRPAALVAPRFRHLPGALAEWSRDEPRDPRLD